MSPIVFLVFDTDLGTSPKSRIRNDTRSGGADGCARAAAAKAVPNTNATATVLVIA